MEQINVTAAHIARGRPWECHLCPVALAIIDHVEDHPAGAFADVEVSPCVISVFRNDECGVGWVWTETPLLVAGWIQMFDQAAARRELQPFTFELPPIETWETDTPPAQ